MKVVENKLKWVVRLKNRFLSLTVHFLVTFNCFHPLPFISDCFHSLSINSNHFQLSLIVFDCFYTNLRVTAYFYLFFNHFWLFCIIFDCSHPFFMIFHHLRPLWLVFNYLYKILIIFSEIRLLWAIFIIFQVIFTNMNSFLIVIIYIWPLMCIFGFYNSFLLISKRFYQILDNTVFHVSRTFFLLRVRANPGQLRVAWPWGPGSRASKNGLDLAQPDPQTVYSQTMCTVNLGKVLPNDERVLLIPDMWELGRFNGKDDFGMGKALLLQEGLNTFRVGTGGWHDDSHQENSLLLKLT